MPPNTRNRDPYGVGIVCALPLEKAAVIGMLDEEHPKLQNAEGDVNDYTLGRMGEHNVVVACLPAGVTGKASAASVATDMMRSFPIRIGLMVGIGGGVPSKRVDIRLGDVIVSQPTDQHGGVVQWDFGKTEKGGLFRRTGMLNKPPRALLNALSGLQARHEVEEPETVRHVEMMLSKRPRMAKSFCHQGRENDQLFEGDYEHVGEETCDRCDKEELAERPPREDSREIVIHFGNIASGDEVMKDGKTRDRIAASEGVICFEMEAAGLMDSFPCLVIRGVCDYADSHKNKRWQRYAAAAAAAYAKELLLGMPTAEVTGTQLADEATHSSVKRIVYLPFSKNHHFVGRRSLLESLEQRLLVRNDCPSLAVAGLGGIGKTQVVLSFAHLVSEKHPEFSVFWVPAVSTETIEQAFEEIAKLLGLISESDEKKDVKTLVRRHLSTPAASKWLLIVDNADSEDVVYGKAQVEGLNAYLPQSELGLTIFTIRNYGIAQGLVGPDVIEVERMQQEEAMTMLEGAVGRKALLNDNETRSELLTELDNLPLAITQAAAYVNVNRISISDYLDIIRSTEQNVVEIMGSKIRDNTRYKQSANAVATTWIISFQQIVEQDSDAADLLRYMSCIEWKAIPESILPQVEPEARMMSAIGMLCSYSFLVRRHKEKTYDMHRLVHLATRIWDRQYGRPDETRQKAMLHLSEIFPFGEYEKRDIWRAYLPHAARINGDTTGQDIEGKGEFCRHVGYCLQIDGKTKDAVLWLEESCQCLRNLVEDESNRLSSQHTLAIAYQANGQVKEAVQLLEHVVAIESRVLAEEHPDRLASQHELARVSLANGQMKEAVELLEHVVAIESRVLAEEHPYRLVSQHVLAGAYLANRQIKEAVELLEYVVAIREKVLAEEHPHRLVSQHELAGAYLANGQIKEAVELQVYVVAIWEKVLAEEHPDRLTSQHELARMYKANGQTKEAVELLEHVVAIGSRVLAEDHPDRLISEQILDRWYQEDVLQHV